MAAAQAGVRAILILTLRYYRVCQGFRMQETLKIWGGYRPGVRGGLSEPSPSWKLEWVAGSSSGFQARLRLLEQLPNLLVLPAGRRQHS